MLLYYSQMLLYYRRGIYMRKLKAKPILKWAGGKTQLLDTLIGEMKKLKNTKELTYIEPFLGGASLFITVAKLDLFNDYIINDINWKLINVYIQVRDNPGILISELKKLKLVYIDFDEESRKKFYYKKREEFNVYGRKEKLSLKEKIKFAALFIFLNKTCFNGLYRENSNGDFNVPSGKYKNPSIYDAQEIFSLSELLNIKDKSGKNKIKIFSKNYLDLEDKFKDNSFIYFDPPYRPITKGGFNTYHKSQFNDSHQIELAKYFKKLNQKGNYLMLSNSDPKNLDKSDDFFDSLYSDFNIYRVNARRSINSNGSKRGEIFEILVTNF